MWHLAFMNMQPAKLGTTMQMREHLAGIQEMPGIKRTFQPLLLFQVIFGELDCHQVTLFNTNAMFTGQHTTHFNTAFQNIGTEILGTF
jgi:hypothetical protein